MSLRRCPNCSLNFPPYSPRACEVCGDDTVFHYGDKLPENWREDVDLKLAKVGFRQDENEKIAHWRANALKQGGLVNEVVIEALAESNVDFRRAIDMHKQGCPELRIMEIML